MLAPIVGQRSNTETIVAILKAFLDHRTWKQADLARHVGVSTAALHKRLVELQSEGVPLTSEREHPHVYWSVPKQWYPGGVVFTSEQVTELLRQLLRLPQSKGRGRLVETLRGALPRPSGGVHIVAPESTAREEEHLPTLEDAAERRVSLRFRYYTATSGKEGSRHASVHRVRVGPPARFVATCHRSGTIKWFRVESVSDARLDEAEPYRHAADDAVEAFLRESLDGFHEGTAPALHAFFVCDPDARWVARNLMEGMRAEEVPGGIRVSIETAALDRLARYVVGLGGSSKPLTGSLAREVERLARGALKAIEG